MRRPEGSKPTAVRILDAAEDLFAEHGYDATSLGDVADHVGIRQPSLYNHFKNKQDLYVATLERLLDPFLVTVEGIVLEGSAPENAEKLVSELMSYYAQHPNLARMIQHAVLSSDAQVDLLVDRWFKPFLAKAMTVTGDPGHSQVREDLSPFVVMAYNSMMLGYVTFAPIYRRLLDIEPLCPEATQRQIEVLDRFAVGLSKDAGSVRA